MTHINGVGVETLGEIQRAIQGNRSIRFTMLPPPPVPSPLLLYRAESHEALMATTHQGGAGLPPPPAAAPAADRQSSLNQSIAVIRRMPSAGVTAAQALASSVVGILTPRARRRSAAAAAAREALQRRASGPPWGQPVRVAHGTRHPRSGTGDARLPPLTPDSPNPLPPMEYGGSPPSRLHTGFATGASTLQLHNEPCHVVRLDTTDL